MIRVLVDSASDYTQQEIKEKQLHLVPLQIHMQGKHFFDGVDITQDDFYEMLISGKEFPKTSQPSPQDFLTIFEDVKAQGEQLICILLSSALSGTYQSALLAKEMVAYEHIYLVDSLSAVAAIRILCDHALTMIQEGKQVIDIVEDLESLKKQIRIFAAVDTLEYLYRGGRISKNAATIGTMAKLKPIITVGEEGNVDIAAKRLGIGKTLRYLAEKVEELKINKEYPFYSLFSYGSENCEKMEAMLQEKGVVCTRRLQIGPAIGAHIGPEAFGVCFVEK